MKKYFCTTICTVIFAALVITGCTGNKSTGAASGREYTQQQTQAPLADAKTDGMKVPDESTVPSESATETLREGQTEKEMEGQTVVNEAQTDKGETKTEGGEQQTEPSAAAPGTTTTQPETKSPAKAPAQSTVKPEVPAQPETQAPTKAPAQSTVKPSAPAQPETKAPAQSAPKPSVPAQPETQAPTKAPTQSTVKPSAPAQPETQVPTKAPETPKKEKTMWDAPYDVEAIKAYMVSELKARGYEYYPELAEKNYASWVEKWGEESAKENYNDYYNINPESSAWDNFCTATAGPNRYYDNINHCTVGHQHYNWSNPATGAGERKNSDGLTSLEFYVNDALDYWCYMYGEGHMFPEEYREESKFTAFTIYTEKFDDGCVIFYILA